jgi:hypothetical protein
MAAKKAVQPSVSAAEAKKPITVIEMGGFRGPARKLLSEDQIDDLIYHVSNFRELGTIISGTGGLQKMRLPKGNNRGKSSGIRIVYLYIDDDCPLYLFGIYAKNEKISLNQIEKNFLKGRVSSIKKHFARKKLRVIQGRKQ